MVQADKASVNMGRRNQIQFLYCFTLQPFDERSYRILLMDKRFGSTAPCFPVQQANIQVVLQCCSAFRLRRRTVQQHQAISSFISLMRESTLTKVAAFTFNPHLRLILGSKENALDFRRIMDEGRVLIADLGRCDPETRRLLGSLIVTGLELAALSRKDIDKAENRRLFHR